MERTRFLRRLCISLTLAGLLIYLAASAVLAAAAGIVPIPRPVVLALIGTYVLSLILIRRHRAVMTQIRGA